MTMLSNLNPTGAASLCFFVRYGCFDNLHISQLRDMTLARMVGLSYTKANSLIAAREDSTR